jgi:hypothetical protein
MSYHYWSSLFGSYCKDGATGPAQCNLLLFQSQPSKERWLRCAGMNADSINRRLMSVTVLRLQEITQPDGSGVSRCGRAADARTPTTNRAVERCHIRCPNDCCGVSSLNRGVYCVIRQHQIGASVRPHRTDIHFIASLIVFNLPLISCR